MNTRRQAETRPMNFVTVWHNGSALLLYRVVADRLGLRAEQGLTEAEFWNAVQENASHGIAIAQALLHPSQ